MKILRQNQKHNNRKGFTLAELLVTVGILAVLLALTLVAVNAYNSRLKLLQMDNTAKDIFIVAQNHLTASEVSGKLGVYIDGAGNNTDGRLGTQMTLQPADFTQAKSDAGLDSDLEWNDSDYYFIDYYPSTDAASGSTDANTQKLDDTILNYMLPNASIQDDIRTMGHYIIEYNVKTGSVYGVFYTDSSKGLSYNDVLSLSNMGGRADSAAGKEARRTYTNSKGKDIIGYYGGAMADSLIAANLDDLTMKITNADTLKVEITDPNYFKTAGSGTDYYFTSVAVTVKGIESGKEDTFLLDLTDNDFTPTKNSVQKWWDVETVTSAGSSTTKALKYTLTLDDITTPGGHFADICPDLIPGEDIVITAASSSKTVLSGVKTVRDNTNSLFASSAIDYDTDAKKDLDTRTVSISSIRHLENLDPDVSGVPTKTDTAEKINFYVAGAVQTANLDWDEFTAKDGATSGRDSICKYGLNSTATGNWLAENSYYGIENPALTSYNGSKKSISNMVIKNTAGDAGLFRTISSKKMTISNLMLKNFQVSGKTGAGALAGSVKSITAEEAEGVDPIVRIMNVGVALTNGTSAADTADSKYNSGSYTIKASAGSAGGLIGSSARETHIVNAFASVPVSASASAGGLIGEITTGGTDHSIIKNSYSGGRTVSGKYDTAAYNVTSTGGSAGGLIGAVTAPVEFTSDYSTCSVSASAYGGGFIGNGTASGTSFGSCYATGLISASAAAEGGFAGRLTAGSGSGTYMDGITSGISGIGSNASGVTAAAKSYDTMAAAENSQATAAHTVAYDSTHSGKAYPFTAVNGIGFDGVEYAHWGDWPDKPANKTMGSALFAYYEHMSDGTDHWHVLGVNDNGKIDTVYDDLVKTHGLYVSNYGYGFLIPAEGISGNNVNSYFSKGNKPDNYDSGTVYNIAGVDYYYFKYIGTSTNNVTLSNYKKGKGNASGTVSYIFNPMFGDTMTADSTIAAKFGYSSDNYFQARSVGQLKNVGNSSTYLSKYYRQTCDINMNNVDVFTNQAIGNDSTGPFTGNYDATGVGSNSDYEIINYKNTYICGLFGYTSGATIKGVNISGTITDGSVGYTGSMIIGGLVDYAGNSSNADTKTNLINCNTNVSITLSSNYRCDNLYSGGLVGRAYYISCSNCSSKGKILLKSKGVNVNAELGGIAGYSEKGLYETCNGNATVSLDGSTISTKSYNGGFIGYSSSDSFNECINNGEVKMSSAAVNSDCYTGGFAGYSEKGKYKDCVENATLTFEKTDMHTRGYLGGFIGNSSSENFDGCISNGNVKLSSVTVSSYSYIGGFTGHSENGNYKECAGKGGLSLADNTFRTDNYAGGFVGYSSKDVIGKVVESGYSCITEGEITLTNTEGGINARIGGFTGYAYKSDFEYDKSAANLKIGTPFVANTSMNASGFAGVTESCTIKNSVSSGTVGIDNSTASAGCNTTNIGGMAGYSTNTKYLSDKSTGNITANLKVNYINTAVRVGGFTGYSYIDTIGDADNENTPNIVSNNISVKISGNYPALRVGGFSGICVDSTVAYGAVKGTIDLNNNLYSQNNGSAYIGGFAGYAENYLSNYNQEFYRCWSKETISNVNGYSAGMAAYATYAQFIDCYAATQFSGTTAANTWLFTNDNYGQCRYTFTHGVELDSKGKPIVSAKKFRSSNTSTYSNNTAFMALTSAADGYYNGYYSSLNSSTESMATMKAYFANNDGDHWITDDTVDYPQLKNFPESAAVTAQSVKSSARKAKQVAAADRKKSGTHALKVQRTPALKIKGLAEMKLSVTAPAAIIKQMKELNN